MANKRKFLVDIDLNQNELQYPKIHNLPSAPVGPTSGQVYFNTTDDKLWYWDGSVWVDVTSVNLEGTSPITVTQSGGTYSIGITNATTGADGAMSSTDKTILDGATSSNIADQIVKRDSNGEFSATQISGLTGPTLGNDAANKNYVDDSISNITHTGVEVSDPLTVSQVGNTFSVGINATSSNVANYVVLRDSNGSFSATTITGLTAPSNGTDAANKDYVDALVQGLDPKESCRAISTTASITLSGTQTIDGVSLIAGDRVLVAAQGGNTTTPHVDNGIYEVSAGTWSRTTDADGTPSSEVTAGVYTFIEEGTSYADAGWVLSTNNPIVVDTTPLQFVQFSQAGVIEAGSGLSKSGNTLNVGQGNGITVGATDVSVTAGTGITVDTSGVNVDGSSLSGTGVTWNPTTGQFEVDPGVTDIVSGSGLTANGTTGSITLDVGQGNGITVGATDVSVTAGTGITVDTSGVNVDGSSLSGSGLTWNPTTGQFETTSTADITEVIAGDGLVGGGTQGSVTLDVNVGVGLTVSAGTVSALTDGSTIQTNLNGELEVIPGTYPTKYTQASVSVGSTPGPQTITHNLNSLYVNVSVFDSTTGEEYVLGVDHITANSVTLEAKGATTSVNVIVIG